MERVAVPWWQLRGRPSGGRRRRSRSLVGTVAAAVVAGSVLTAAPAGAGTIAGDRAQASALAAAIAADSARIDQLSQQYDRAQTREAATAAAMAQLQVRLTAARTAAAASRARLRRDAVAAYMGAQGGAALSALFVRDGTGAAARSEYQALSDGALSAAIDRYRADERTVAGQQQQLAAARAAQQATLASLARTEQQAQAAVAAEQAQLNQVNADLQQQLIVQAHAILVAQEEAAAQAAAQRQAQQAAAAQAQVPPTRSGGGRGTSGSGGAPSPPVPSPPTRPAPPPSATWTQQAAVAVHTALAQVGTPYVWGGASPGGFDCSGLVMYAWSAAGVQLPHYSVSQYDVTTHLTESELLPGDIVFYNSPYDGYLGHEAMYIGNGRVVQAPMTGMDVQVTSITWAGPPVAFGRPG